MKMLEKHQSQIELMRVMHKMDDFFGEMKKQETTTAKRKKRKDFSIMKRCGSSS